MSDVMNEVSNIGGSVDQMNRVSGSLSISYYSLIVWICLITLALIAIASLSLYRKSFRHDTYPDSATIVSYRTDSIDVIENRPEVDRRCGHLGTKLYIEDDR